MRGQRAHLRTTTEADLADHVRWHADLEATRWLARRPLPDSVDARKKWLEGIAGDRLLFHWEIAAGERHIGYCQTRLSHDGEWWDLGPFLLAPEARGQGYGRDAAHALHRYLITYLGLRGGSAWLFWDDGPGRRLADWLGYAQIGHGRDAFYRSGRYWDEWWGALGAEDFRARFPDAHEYPEHPDD